MWTKILKQCITSQTEFIFTTMQLTYQNGSQLGALTTSCFTSTVNWTGRCIVVTTVPGNFLNVLQEKKKFHVAIACNEQVSIK